MRKRTYRVGDWFAGRGPAGTWWSLIMGDGMGGRNKSTRLGWLVGERGDEREGVQQVHRESESQVTTA